MIYLSFPSVPCRTRIVSSPYHVRKPMPHRERKQPYNYGVGGDYRCVAAVNCPMRRRTGHRRGISSSEHAIAGIHTHSDTKHTKHIGTATNRHALAFLRIHDFTVHAICNASFLSLSKSSRRPVKREHKRESGGRS